MKSLPMENSLDALRGSTVATFGNSSTALVGSLILLAVIPYLNTLLNGFVYDDTMQILENPYIRSFDHLKEIFGTTIWSSIGDMGGTNYYRPMMTFGYLICHQLFGPLAYGFHLTNLLLHAATVCILFFLSIEIFEDRSLALLAAGLFALHPIHTMSAERHLRALSLDPFDSHAHFQLATLYAAAHRTSEALLEYKAGLLMNPTNSEAQAAVKRLQSQTPGAKP